MAQKKFLSYDGFKYFINKAIGKTDISAIGDGTATGAISELNNAFLKCSTVGVQSPYLGISAKSTGTTVLDISSLDIPNNADIKAILLNESTNGISCYANYENRTNTSVSIVIKNYLDTDFYGHIYPYVTVIYI